MPNGSAPPSDAPAGNGSTTTLQLRAPLGRTGRTWLLSGAAIAGLCFALTPVFGPDTIGIGVFVGVITGLGAYFRTVRTLQIDGDQLISNDVHLGRAAVLDLSAVQPVVADGSLYLLRPNGTRDLVGCGSPQALQKAAGQIRTRHQGSAPGPGAIPHVAVTPAEQFIQRSETMDGTDLELAARRTPALWALAVAAPALLQVLPRFGGDFGWRYLVYFVLVVGLLLLIDRLGWVRFELRARALTVVRRRPYRSVTVPYDAVAAVDVHRGPKGIWSFVRIELADGTIVRSFLGRHEDQLEIGNQLNQRRVDRPEPGPPKELLALTERA